MQLELGSTATEFNHKNIREQLADCQRYYEKQDGFVLNDLIAIGNVNSTTATFSTVNFSEKRVKPTVTLSDKTTFQYRYNGGQGDPTQVAADLATLRSFRFEMDDSAAPFTGADCIMFEAKTTGASIEIDAEL